MKTEYYVKYQLIGILLRIGRDDNKEYEEEKAEVQVEK